MTAYWNALQERICHKCIDGDRHGNCCLPAGEVCQLKEFLPQIVSTVANVHHHAMESYISALRRNVCILCDWQQSDGTCVHRNQLECALDRYFPLVVEIIEDVRSRKESELQELMQS